MADDYSDVLAQAQASEAQEHQQASASLGAIQTANEQDGYQQTLDQQRAAQPPLQAASADQPGILSRLAGGVKDIVTHPVDDVKRAWDGAVNGAANIPYFMEWAGFSLAAKAGITNQADTTGFLKEEKAGYQAAAQKLSLDTDADNTGGGFVQGLAQWYFGKRALMMGGASSAVANVGSMVAAFDPDDKHFTDLLAQVPGLNDKFKSILETKPGDPEIENRFKQLFDGIAGEAGATLAGAVVNWARGARAASQLAEDTTASTKLDPTTIPKNGPAPEPAPTAPPEVSPGEPAATAEGKPGEAEAPAEPKPWTPEAVKDADTANPKGEGGVPVEEPKPAAGGPEEQPKPGEAPTAVFNPNTIAETMSIPKDATEAVLKAINEGRFNDVPAMLDDTHRTIPWDQLSDGANLKGVLNAVEANIGDTIKAAHGTGAVSADSIRQLAADIGGDRESLARLYGDTTAQGGLAARITAGYNMLIASAKQVRDLAANVRDLDPSSEAGAQAALAFQKQLNIHAAITGEVRQSSAEIGRALYAHRALKASTDVALQGLQDYASTTLGPKALKDLAKQVANSKDLSALTNASDQLQKKGWKGVLQEVAQNGMLSGPTTQLTNIVGNSSNILLKMAERYIAGGIGDVRGVLFPSADSASLREAVAHTQGAYEGLKVAANLAWNSIKDENFTSKFSPASSRAIDVATPGAAHTLQEAVGNAIGGNASAADFTYRQAINSLGTVIRWPGRFMGLFDHFSQGIGYHADLNARAYVQAAQEADAQGLQGSARDTFLDQRMDEIKANPLKEVEDKAMAQGQYTAFLEPPQTKTGAAVMKMVNSMDPIAKLIIAPFIHRPGNFLRQALGDYTVAGLAQKNIRSMLASGGSDADLAMARMAIGTSAMTGAMTLAMNGQSVGARLGNQNTESLDAVPPYSVKIGDRWYKYDRLDPVGTWLAVGADLHEAFSHAYDPNDPDSTNALQKASAAAVMAVSHATLDKTFMKSVDMLMQAFSERDPAKAELLASRAISENVAKLLPFSGLARSVAHGTDDVQRAGGKGSMFDGVVASIPYLSQNLPPRRDLLGRPMPAVSAWNPFFASTGNTDNMDQQLSRVAMNINAPVRTIDGYTLNAHEYDEVVTNATQTKMFPGGTTVEGYLNDLTNSPVWKENQSAPDGGQFRNGMMVQKALDAAYQYGRDKYKADHPDLEMAKQAEQQARFKNSIAPLMQFGQ